MKIILYSTLCLVFFSSCNDKNIVQSEKIFGYPLKGKIEYLSKSEHWNNFNGDGYRVEVYKILDPEYFKRKFNDNFKVFDFRKKDNPLKNTNYSEYIENGAGFYKSLWNKDEIKTVVIDTVNNKFLYYYCSM